MAHHAIVLYAGKQLTCLSPCQYYEYSFHCIHAILICVKYCKALMYSIYFNVLKYFSFFGLKLVLYIHIIIIFSTFSLILMLMS